MIGPSKKTRVFVYASPCDMRKSFNTLAGLVSQMGHDVIEGDVFLFVGRTKKRAKVIWYDGTGLLLLAKRLDVGTFAAPWAAILEDGRDFEMSMSELALFLEGCQAVGKMKLSPEHIDKERASRLDPDGFR